uniref:Peptidase metallopeptidase domain-containing protein n=2 Tax=Ascaris TaxID=6251 RepID=A0A9J2P4M2_ASCLU
MVKQQLTLLGTLLSVIMPNTRAYPLMESGVGVALSQVTPNAARALSQQNAERLIHAQEYLERFGFIKPLDKGRPLHDSIARFQYSSGLTISGQLDDETFREMLRPRCASVIIHKRRTKRFATAQTSRWDKLSADNVLKLKWFISHYTKDMPRSEIRSIVRKSFALWSTQTMIQSMPSVNLQFEEAEREADADITILWAEGDHGDAYKFDGTGDHTNILAHTFYPTYQETGTLNGDIHLDDSEKWTSDGNGEGTAFSNVFVHEIGHALGLGHSKRQDAIMFPIYKKGVLEQGSFDLDDKCALNWNYIGPSNLCLFVWLMSEVLPRQIEHKAAMDIDSNLMSSMLTTRQSVTSKLNDLKKKLHATVIPQCKEDNNVKERFETLLQKKLDFPYESARQYIDVVCNFLNGLHKYYQEERTHRKETDDELITVRMAHDFIREHTLPTHRASRRQRRRLPTSHRRRHTHTSVFDPRFFDSKFFNHFFTLLVQ